MGKYESDHTAFLTQGVPCVALTSSGVADSFLHSPADTPEWIKPDRLGQVVSLIAAIVEGLRDKSPAWSRP